jgi:hypothetical protein
MVAFEAAVIDWLPLARIPSWPGAESPNRTRPKIRLQSDSCLSTPIDNGHGASTVESGAVSDGGGEIYELTSLSA